MNGSDLESDFGLATADLAQMLDSGLRSENANVIILTGGANRWMNTAIPETECIIWELADGWLNEIKNMDKVNMGNPATLRNFIKYSMHHYPAEKFGLIMWDHGGGSIAGFGHDEKFSNSYLSLNEMKQAFEEAGLGNKKLEFLGFDACLMATVEMAVLAADYAHVLIASEDLEPGEGWDYNFLAVLNENPHMDGFELGKVIVDMFIDFFGQDSDEILTLSVVDLAKVQPVMQAMGRLMARATEELQVSTWARGFNAMATRRADTKTFGEGSPRDNYADMVDIGDMAIMLADFFPCEAAAVLRALNNCVVYNRHNSDIDLWGLSTFYIYGGKSIAVPSLKTYASLGMDEAYTNYLHKFYQGLEMRAAGRHAPIVRRELALWQPVSKVAIPNCSNIYRMTGLLQTERNDDFLWPKINGHPVALFPIASTKNARIYAIPAEIDDMDVDIVVSFSQTNPRGRILGSRNKIENVFPKGYDPILPGSQVAIYYYEFDFDKNTDAWVKGDPFTANRLRLTWEPPAQGCRVGYRTTDVSGKFTHHLSPFSSSN